MANYRATPQPEIKKVWGNDVSFRWHITERQASGEVVDFDLSKASTIDVLVGYWNEKQGEFPKESRMVKDDGVNVIAQIDPSDSSHMIVTIKGNAEGFQKSGVICATLRCDIEGKKHRCTDEHLFAFVDTTDQTKDPGAQDGSIDEDVTIEAESIIIVQGPAGESAYTMAVTEGYQGTKKELAQSLAILPTLIGGSNYLGIFASDGEFDAVYDERFPNEEGAAWGWVGGNMAAVKVRQNIFGEALTFGQTYDLTDFSAVRASLEKEEYLTREQYDAKVAAGTIEEDHIYNIFE